MDAWRFWEAYGPNVGVASVWAAAGGEKFTPTAADAIVMATAAAQKRADDAYAASPAEVLRLHATAFLLRARTPTLAVAGNVQAPRWLLNATGLKNVRAYAKVPAGWTTYDVRLGANDSASPGDLRLQTSINLVGADGGRGSC